MEPCTSRYTFERCIQLSKAEIAEATSSSNSCRALLEHMADVSRPKDGAPLMLLILARMASLACNWLRGGLRIELDASGADSVAVDIMIDLGNAQEQVFPALLVRAPLSEFAGAIERIPQMIHPLAATTLPGRLVLTATEQIRRSTIAPPILVEESLAAIPGAPRVPSLSN